jgi:hypothetical protein
VQGRAVSSIHSTSAYSISTCSISTGDLARLAGTPASAISAPGALLHRRTPRPIGIYSSPSESTDFKVKSTNRQYA